MRLLKYYQKYFQLLRAEKFIQRTKRKIIISTQTGLFWNSDAIQFDQILKTILEPLNMNLFMDSLLELKRVHIERAKEITHVPIKTIRHFCFLDRDRDVISDTTYDIMIVGSAEKSDLKQLSTHQKWLKMHVKISFL